MKVNGSWKLIGVLTPAQAALPIKAPESNRPTGTRPKQ
jgi:hypothetical protein